MMRSKTIVSKTAVSVKGGMVSTQHPLASEAGARILAAGGNAIDAAVAAAVAVTVVEPMMSGIGGGGVMMVHDPKTGTDTAVDFLPRAPGAARGDMFELDKSRSGVGMYEWPAVVGDANFVGHRSVGVPGTIAGLCESHARWGKLPLSEVLAPAIEFAEDGHMVEGYITALIAGMARRLRQFPAAAEIFLPDGLPPAFTLRVYMPADKFRQPDLAATLKRIAAHGAEDFYRGKTAKLLVAEMERGGGLINAEDLAGYKPIFHEETRKIAYRDHVISTLPAPCGSNTVIEALNILENFDVRSIGRESAEGLHLMAQAQALAFQDRFAYLADVSAGDVPEAELLSKDFAKTRAELIRLDRRIESMGPGSPSTKAQLQPGLPQDRSCTTHLGVVDKDGMVVSLTNTVGDLWGSFVVPRGTGMVLNDGMVWFDPVPGRINSIAPGKMPLSAISAVIVHKDGKPRISNGAPGARKVMSAILQSLVNVIDHGMTLQDGIAAPRIHCEKETVLADSRLPAESLETLKEMGHPIQLIDETFLSSNFARPVGALIDPDGTVHSGVDALRPATAVGVPA
ncbi:gamma-glutamyltransferase [Corticibacterium sp. UT-5YL-CI-8]|nr:gamma-glutamyltransferase [Tianweitania sp. UT-5YL-CI-8]